MAALPDETEVASATDVHASGLQDAMLMVRDDRLTTSGNSCR